MLTLISQSIPVIPARKEDHDLPSITKVLEVKTEKFVMENLLVVLFDISTPKPEMFIFMHAYLSLSHGNQIIVLSRQGNILYPRSKLDLDDNMKESSEQGKYKPFIELDDCILANLVSGKSRLPASLALALICTPLS